jgi:RNA polymerase sigma factor (sigma-70 family)
MRDHSQPVTLRAQARAANGKSDGELARLYAETGSEEAFAELGRRYARLIYTTCLRETGDRTLAEDASQGVLLLLSRKAGALSRQETLAGWLYTASRYVARNLQKQERRRLMNESKAATETANHGAPGNPLWERIEPHFHDALDRLKPTDREAILLRYVQEQSLAEVGASLGVSENTARMRVTRALEKIRAHLRKVGITIAVGALAVLLEERAAEAVPARVLQAAQIAGNPSYIPSGTVAQAVRQTSQRLAFPPLLRSLLVIVTLLPILSSVVLWRANQPQTLPLSEQNRLFAALAGTWKGSLEFADDRTGQHFTYPTTVVFGLQNQGNTLQFVASYAGSSRVDITTFARNPATGGFTVQNGGPASSHRLAGAGDLLRLGDGEAAFQGRNLMRDSEVRIRFLLASNRLTMQEEYRRPEQSRYQFRNRFTLQKP